MLCYRPIDAGLAGVGDDHTLYQLVASQLDDLAKEGTGDLAMVQNTPLAAVHIWRVWQFLCEIDGSGLAGYPAGTALSLRDLRGVHESLGEVGAVELRSLLECAVLSDSEAKQGEYWNDPGAGKWVGEVRDGSRLSSQDIDRLARELIYPVMSSRVASYIRTHWKELSDAAV